MAKTYYYPEGDHPATPGGLRGLCRCGITRNSRAARLRRPRRFGGSFTAWDGYIKGKYIGLEPGKKISGTGVVRLPEEATQSRLEIVLREVKRGTELTMTHYGVPAEAAEDIVKGWKDY